LQTLAQIQIRLALFYLRWRADSAVVTVPTALSLAQKFVGSRLIYYRSDRHSAFNEAHPSVRHSEAYLLEHAPIVAYSSAQLIKAEADQVGSRGRMLEHAVDPNIFNQQLPPAADLAAYPAPRLGFFGSLRGHSLDFELMREVAMVMPEASLLVMGDRSDRASVLDGIENLHVLPPRPHNEMPAAWAALDVALMPYKNTEWMLGVEPIKLREILAVGVPIAAINVGGASAYPQGIFTALTRDEFAPAIRSAIASGRHKDLKFKTWAEQADVLSEWLNALGD
jgi:glycosyltransferase involved in cell wall biosynthesis